MKLKVPLIWMFEVSKEFALKKVVKIKPCDILLESLSSFKPEPFDYRLDFHAIAEKLQSVL